MKMDTRAYTKRWHACLKNRDQKLLHELLAPDAVFHSPIVWTPQEGRPKVEMYLQGAIFVLGNGSFRYVREVFDGPHCVLEFETEVDGITVQGVDMITWNEAGQIVDFKVMIRPLKAIQLVHEKMGRMLTMMGKLSS